MHCDDIHEMLSAYIDEVLDEQDVLEVEKHVRTCDSCRQELAALRETVKILNSLGEVTPPEEFRSQLILRLRTEGHEAGEEIILSDGKLSGLRQWLSGINKHLVAAVLMIGLGIGTGLYQLSLTSGHQAYDLLMKTSQDSAAESPGSTRQQTSEAAAPEIATPELAANLPMASKAAPPDQSESNTDSGETDAGPRGKMAAGFTSNIEQSSPGFEGEAQSKAQIEPQNPVSEPAPTAAADLPAPADNSASKQAEDGSNILNTPTSGQAQNQAVRPLRSMADSGAASAPGNAAGNAANNAADNVHEQPGMDSALSREMSKTAASPTAKVKSDNYLPRSAWWVLPGILVAGGCGLVGYYLGRRREKKS